MTIYITSDHAGFDLKEQIQKHFSSITMIDLGPYTKDPVDYVDYAVKACKTMNPLSDKTILICGSGIGMSITANRFKNIRAALCFDIETAKLSRQHNDANVLCLGARLLKKENAFQIVDAFLKTPFSREERHIKRIKKIEDIESVSI